MNGILLINKDLGYTSRDLVNQICNIFNTKKVGHTGTLDPNASGVMVICIGQALKVCELLQSNDKEYVAGVTLGIETDTLDMDTNATILHDVNVEIDKEIIKNVVSSFKGKYMQEVPKYSSVKVNGRKLYEYARNNIPVKLPSKEVEIKNIEIIDDIIYDNGKIYFKIKTTVSKGTYIRSLIRDIGKKLSCPAVMNSLVRTRQGIFNIDNSYNLDDVKMGNYKIISIMDALPNIKKIIVNDEVAFRIKNGVIMDRFFEDEMAFILDKDNNLIALYKNDGKKSRAYKMFL